MTGFSLGKLAIVKRGKHVGVPCVVVGRDPKDGRWLVVDGNLMPVIRPKRKNPRHLRQTRLVLKEVAQRITEGKVLDNGWLRTQLLSASVTEELLFKEAEETAWRKMM